MTNGERKALEELKKEVNDFLEEMFKDFCNVNEEKVDNDKVKKVLDEANSVVVDFEKKCVGLTRETNEKVKDLLCTLNLDELKVAVTLSVEDDEYKNLDRFMDLLVGGKK